MAVDANIERYREFVDERILAYLPPLNVAEGGLAVEAARYSVAAGGKRIRPVLLLMTAQMLGVDRATAYPFAVALEFIHTYSLIHDDLPAMDNDLLRRGQPTCHAQYGEAIAILAGDGLLNRAYEILFETMQMSGTAGALDAAQHIATAAGFMGMVGGQCLDLTATEAPLQTVQAKKTGALIRAAVLAAAALARAEKMTTTALDRFASALGLAFQIKDDLLDVSATAAELGKSIGKDARDEKQTFVTVYGAARATAYFQQTMQEAADALATLRKTGHDVTDLDALWRYLEKRSF